MLRRVAERLVVLLCNDGLSPIQIRTHLNKKMSSHKYLARIVADLLRESSPALSTFIADEVVCAGSLNGSSHLAVSAVHARESNYSCRSNFGGVQNLGMSLPEAFCCTTAFCAVSEWLVNFRPLATEPSAMRYPAPGLGHPKVPCPGPRGPSRARLVSSKVAQSKWPQQKCPFKQC
jgi:hypothetical protein